MVVLICSTHSRKPEVESFLIARIEFVHFSWIFATSSSTFNCLSGIPLKTKELYLSVNWSIYEGIFIEKFSNKGGISSIKTMSSSTTLSILGMRIFASS